MRLAMASFMFMLGFGLYFSAGEYDPTGLFDVDFI
jgi:hypothetical protein